MDPSQAVRDEIADLSRGDLEAVLGYYTDDVYFEDTSVPTPCRTKAEMRDFMKVFYDKLGDGKPVPGALRMAAAAVRANPGTQHPYYWAVFLGYGPH